MRKLGHRCGAGAEVRELAFGPKQPKPLFDAWLTAAGTFKTQIIIARIFYSEPIQDDIYYSMAREALCEPQTAWSLLHGHYQKMHAFV